MSLITPEQRAMIVKIYVSAFRAVDVKVEPELIEIDEDFSAILEHEDMDQVVLRNLLDNEDLTVLYYEPGHLEVMDKVAKEYHSHVAPAMRKLAEKR